MTSPESHRGLRTVVFKDANVALALSARVTMDHPAFARLPFGTWTRILAAQAARGHTRFVLDATDVVVGFFGYALTDRAAAEAWAFAGADLPDDACRAGDCAIFNAWAAADAAVNAAMLDEVRGMRLAAAYYKRFYPDGRVRPVRLPITDPRFPLRGVRRRG